MPNNVKKNRKIAEPIFLYIGSFWAPLQAGQNKPIQRKIGATIFLLGRFILSERILTKLWKRSLKEKSKGWALRGTSS